jgi:hypothetical protein
MKCRSQLVARSVLETIRTGHALSLLSVRSVSIFTSVRCLHTSHLRQSTENPTFTSATVQLAETPLKIASASGDTPPPEDPEGAGDHDSSQRDERSPFLPRLMGSDSFARPPSRARGRPRGSSSRRGPKSHHTNKPTMFKPDVPDWFISRNVTLFSNAQPIKTSEVSDKSDTSVCPGDPGIPLINTSQPRLVISPFIRKEFEAHLSAALLVQPGNSRETIAARKTHIHLQCPKRGAIYFLDDIIESAASELEADLVRLDGQDFEELLEHLIDPTSPIMGIGHPHIFFTDIVRDQSKDSEQKEEISSEEENEELDEEEETTDEATELRVQQDLPLRLFRLLAPRGMYPMTHSSNSSIFPHPSRPPTPKDENDSKITSYLDLLISAPIDKRKLLAKKAQRSGDTTTTFQLSTGTNRTIIYLRDFQSILDSPRGQIAHQALLHVIQNRRRLGEKIVLVVSDDFPGEGNSSVAFSSQYYHSMKIPPPVTEIDKSSVRNDRDARKREINLRSIQSAIRQRSRMPSMEFECPVGIHLDAEATSSIHGLDKEVWEINKVQRIVSIAMGNHGRWLLQHRPPLSVPITIADIARAVIDMLKADKERAEVKTERNTAQGAVDPLEHLRPITHEKPPTPQITSRDCNKHEQKLLGGVIDPGW